MKTVNNEQEGTEETEEYPGLARVRVLDAAMRDAIRKLCAAAEEEFPVGTVIEATLGSNRIRGVVLGHVGWTSSFYAGCLMVQNMKTGKKRRVFPASKGQEVRVIELPDDHKPTTNERN